MGSTLTHKHFIAIVRGLSQHAWDQYRGISPITPGKNNPGSEAIGERTANWEEKSWKRLVRIEKKGSAVSPMAEVSAAFMTAPERAALSERLNEAVAHLDITHDELARRIGIGKTTYYAVKGGGGKRSSQLKVLRHLEKLNVPERPEQKRTNPN